MSRVFYLTEPGKKTRERRIGRAMTCKMCGQEIQPGSFVRSQTRVPKTTYWHLKCFNKSQI